MKEIPGFYYDPEKRRYFKITKPGQSGGTSSQLQYTSGSIRTQKRRKLHNDKKEAPKSQIGLAELLVRNRLGNTHSSLYGWFIKRIRQRRTLRGLLIGSLIGLTRVGGSKAVASRGSEVLTVDLATGAIISEDRARLGPIVSVFIAEGTLIGYVTRHGVIGLIGAIGERREEPGEASVLTAQYIGKGRLVIVYEDCIALTVSDLVYNGSDRAYKVLKRGGLGSDVISISSDGVLGLRNGRLWSAEQRSYVKRRGGSKFSHGSTITRIIKYGRFYMISGLRDNLALYDGNFERLIKYKSYCNESKIEHGIDCFDDFVAVACDDNHVRMWHIWTGQLVRSIPVRGHVHSLVFTADGRLVLALDGTVEVYG
ncbi:hypothetical protein TRVA0_017S00452 [Trichomonascus vanleenenianus]|uniref:uncharacterized protein n=1 Tax=Trichomonascus vanleenenianus TaxID=2268995 RepID=UPI003ECA1F58